MQSTITPTAEHNSFLNNIIIRLHKLVLPGIRVRGEFVANTNQSKDYLAFVYFKGIPGLASNEVTNTVGLTFEEISDVDNAVDSIVNNVKRQGLINSYIFTDCEKRN